MASITVKPLQDGIGFGARIWGVTHDTLQDPAIRQQIKDVFEDRAVIVFEDIEQSPRMHVAVSNVISPLKDHATKDVPRVDAGDGVQGVIDMRHDAKDPSIIVEINGKTLTSWLPWHFDHCYNNELNRAGVLRCLEVAPEGGLTGFADGIELYNAISPALRDKIEKHHVLYSLDLAYSRMKFGRPANFKVIEESPRVELVVQQSRTQPRGVHPAVWTRSTGEKVLHVSPWMSWGIEGHEDPEGDALLEAVCQEINAKVRPYFHQWKTSQMLIWDNWRLLHCVSGMDRAYSRHMQRTTIRGDYGLGYFEGGATKGDAILEMTV